MVMCHYEVSLVLIRGFFFPHTQLLLEGDRRKRKGNEKGGLRGEKTEVGTEMAEMRGKKLDLHFKCTFSSAASYSSLRSEYMRGSVMHIP